MAQHATRVCDRARGGRGDPVVKAVGRAAVPVMPRSHAPCAEYILDGGFLLCLMCRRWMEPAPRADGTRAYWCGPPCGQRDLSAGPLESRLELSALTRAVATLHPDLARVRYRGDAPAPGSWADEDGDPARPDAEEVRRWEACDLSDRRALVRAAYVRAEVDASGEVDLVLHLRGEEGV